MWTGTVVKAPDAALVGKALLRNLVYEVKGDCWKGDVFAVKRGAYVAATLRAPKDGVLEMTAGSGLFSKNVQWVRPSE